MADYKFGTDPMMNQFLQDLDAYQRWQLMGNGKKPKNPLPSDYSGGDPDSEELMRKLLERILSQQFMVNPVETSPPPKPQAPDPQVRDIERTAGRSAG